MHQRRCRRFAAGTWRAEKSLQLCSQNPQLRCSRIIALEIRYAVSGRKGIYDYEKVGLFDVELRDPDSVYPIFRSESKENLARILGHEENVHLHNLVVDLNSGKEEAFRAGHEAKHAENYRINSFHLGEGSPKQKFRANMDCHLHAESLRKSA